MFNRRHLRTKALQAVYNYHQKERVGYNLGADFIEEFFLPDLNSMEPQNVPLLNDRKKEALKLFKEHYNKDTLDINAGAQVAKAILGAKQTYVSYLSEEKRNIKDFLIKDTNNVNHNYMSILKFLDDLAKHIDFLYHNNDNKRFKETLNKNDFRLAWSPVFDQLRKDNKYVSYTSKYTFLWQEDDSILKNFYRETLVKSERYETYLSAENSEEEDLSMLVSICRKLLFRNSSVQEFFEEQDPYWDENFDIVSGMLVKTFKKMKNGSEFELINLSPNWEMDKEYLLELYELGTNCPENIVQKIQDKLKNWDIDRLSNVDRYLLELAVQEMIHFPSIPVKVSMNEFLEVAKRYSAPKSKQFINGVLDTVSKELISENIIKKSGRGLIDNK